MSRTKVRTRIRDSDQEVILRAVAAHRGVQVRDAPCSADLEILCSPTEADGIIKTAEAVHSALALYKAKMIGDLLSAAGASKSPYSDHYARIFTRVLDANPDAKLLYQICQRKMARPNAPTEVEQPLEPAGNGDQSTTSTRLTRFLALPFKMWSFARNQ
ncbi:MAG: hypothetical protein IIA66_07390 [Planctomycetes bacterium]|nr:hypothetical protein [Planctomycetota bacterium]